MTPRYSELIAKYSELTANWNIMVFAIAAVTPEKTNCGLYLKQ